MHPTWHLAQGSAKLTELVAKTVEKQTRGRLSGSSLPVTPLGKQQVRTSGGHKCVGAPD